MAIAQTFRALNNRICACGPPPERACAYTSFRPFSKRKFSLNQLFPREIRTSIRPACAQKQPRRRAVKRSRTRSCAQPVPLAEGVHLVQAVLNLIQCHPVAALRISEEKRIPNVLGERIGPETRGARIARATSQEPEFVVARNSPEAFLPLDDQRIADRSQKAFEDGGSTPIHFRGVSR